MKKLIIAALAAVMMLSAPVWAAFDGDTLTVGDYARAKNLISTQNNTGTDQLKSLLEEYWQNVARDFSYIKTMVPKNNCYPRIIDPNVLETIIYTNLSNQEQYVLDMIKEAILISLAFDILKQEFPCG